MNMQLEDIIKEERVICPHCLAETGIRVRYIFEPINIIDGYVESPETESIQPQEAKCYNCRRFIAKEYVITEINKKRRDL